MRIAAFAHLAAFAYLWTLFMGALFWIMLGHVARAVWFVPFRRLTESVTASWPLLVVGAVPLFVTRGAVFATKSALYLGAGVLLAVALRRSSLAQDRAPAPELARRMRRWSAFGLPFWAVAFTLAAFDWFMALDEGFGSSIYGVYVFAGAASSSLALVALLSALARRRKSWALPLAEAHVLALGKLLLTFVAFWAYLFFCQLLLIWIVDLPRESGFLVARLSGDSAALTVALIALHFVLPFFGLLWRFGKLHLGYVASWATLLLVAHFLDVCWLVLPGSGVGLEAILGALLVLALWGGLCAFFALRLARRGAKVALNDPDLNRSLELEPS